MRLPETEKACRKGILPNKGARGARDPGRAHAGRRFRCRTPASPKAPTTTAMTRTVKNTDKNPVRDCARRVDSSARASPSTGARPARGRPLVASPPPAPTTSPASTSASSGVLASAPPSFSSRRASPGRVSPPYCPRAPCVKTGKHVTKNTAFVVPVRRRSVASGHRTGTTGMATGIPVSK